jgi:hypothetical protein
VNGPTGEVLERSLSRLEGLVNQALLSVRLDAGPKLHIETMSVADLLREISEAAVPERDIQIENHAEPALIARAARTGEVDHADAEARGCARAGAARARCKWRPVVVAAGAGVGLRLRVAQALRLDREEPRTRACPISRRLRPLLVAAAKGQSPGHHQHGNSSSATPTIEK